mgnify:CR=1 FL=1
MVNKESVQRALDALARRFIATVPVKEGCEA